ncbi:NADPH-dependent FMN reductase [Novosphingobium taihuense]|nr:NADPH-dependent FMN reductase [Novosphingobium taihuense]
MQDLLEAAGYLFCCPENLGSMTGEMKAFFDRTYYPLLGQIEGRPYATMIAAGSDGTGAERQIDRIVTGWRLRRVAEPMIACTEAQTSEAILARKNLGQNTLENCRALGQAIAVGLALGVF